MKALFCRYTDEVVTLDRNGASRIADLCVTRLIIHAYNVNASFTELNIKARFRATGIMPLDSLCLFWQASLHYFTNFITSEALMKCWECLMTCVIRDSFSWWYTTPSCLHDFSTQLSALALFWEAWMHSHSSANMLKLTLNDVHEKIKLHERQSKRGARFRPMVVWLDVDGTKHVPAKPSEERWGDRKETITRRTSYSSFLALPYLHEYNNGRYFWQVCRGFRVIGFLEVASHK